MTLRTFSILLLSSVIYYLLAKVGMSIFSFHPSNITILWLPFGVAVIMVHKFGIKSLPFVFFGSFTANYSGMMETPASGLLYLCIVAFADTLAPYISSELIKRYAESNCQSTRVLIPFTVYGALIPTFTSSAIIAMTLVSGGYIAYSEIYTFIAILMFSDSLGLFLLFPIYKRMDTLSPITSAEWRAMIFSTLSVFVVVWYSFDYHYLIFLALPLLLVGALKLRTSLLMITLLITVIETISLSTQNGSLFMTQTPIDSILMLMTFLVSMLFVVLGISLHNNELVTTIHLSCTDNLTQTNNLKAYKEQIGELISLFERYETPFSIIIFDIDDFKVINDTYGHRVGDIVLTDLASLIQKNIRTNDTLYRIGGEEFVILLSNTTLDQATAVAEKILIVIKNDLRTIEEKCITISIGVTQVNKGDSEDSLFRRADACLYQSKQNGKNKVTSRGTL